MATTQNSAETTLHITRTYKASAQRVFEAWTRPELMNQWMAPDPAMKCDVRAEARAGGEYAVDMHTADGVRTASGKYVEYDPYSRLAMSWSWDNSATADTLITIDLTEEDGVTTMSFTHSKFQDSSARDAHNEGWTGSFARLDALMAT